MAKLEDLKDTVATLVERVNTLVRELNALTGAHADTVRAATEMRREYDKELALIKREIEEIKKWKEDQKRERDEIGRRFWSFGPNVMGAIINVVLAAIVAYLVANR